MAETNGEFPTVIGTDAKFKGEMSFEKGVRIEGAFEGNIRSKGTLHIAEAAKVSADVEAANVKVEGECKGNLLVTGKLHLLPTAKVEGDLRTNRLEISDGAMFTGHVVTGQAATEMPPNRSAAHGGGVGSPARPAPQPQGQPAAHPRPQPPQPPQEIRLA